TMMFVFLGFIGVVIFSDVFLPHYPIGYLSLLPILWAGMRFSPRTTSTAIILLSCVAVTFTLLGRGPFVMNDPNTSLLLLQTFLGVLSLMGMFLATALQDRRLSEDQTRAINKTLEGK